MNSRPRYFSWRLAAGALALFGSISGHAFAREGDLATKFVVNDENPLVNIPTEEQRNQDPIEFGYFLQDLIARAEGAYTEQNWSEAVRYYKALAKAVPDKGTSFRKLCTAYEQLGDFVNAEGSCWALLQRSGTRVEDHFHFVRLALRDYQKADPQVKELRTKMIDKSIEHLRQHVTDHEPLTEDMGQSDHKQLPLEQQVELVNCQLASYNNDVERLKGCVDALVKVNADKKLVIPFRWALATSLGDKAGVTEVIAEAKRAGLPNNVIEAFEKGPSAIPGNAGPRESEQSGSLAAIRGGSGAPPSAPSPLENWIAGGAAALGLAVATWWFLLRRMHVVQPQREKPGVTAG